MADERTSALPTDANRYEEVARRLALRLYPLDATAQNEKAFAGRTDIPGTRTVLVIDLPRGVLMVSPETVSKWGKSLDELIDVAYANVRKQYPPQVERLEPAEAVVVNAIVEDFYGSTYALRLSEFPQCLGKYGAVVAIPQRVATLVLPIDGPQVATQIPAMVRLVTVAYRDGSEPITPNLYLYHDGRYVPIPYGIKDNELTIEPPKVFFDLLASMSAGER